MANRKVIETYYCDINNLTELLNKLVNSYRLLIGGAEELNKITLAKKSEVKDALKRVDNLGDIIDEVIKAIDHSSYNYTDYCKLKADVIQCKLQVNYIETEIEQEINFKDN